MIRPINKDPILLSLKSLPADINDMLTAQDLLDTLAAHSEECVGMAANMIGFPKRIIAFDSGAGYTVMLNPEIIKCSGSYTAEEGCLSLSGSRKANRFRSITVRYQSMTMRTCVSSFSGFTAQIIQHEIDHCNGILI